MAVLSLPWAFSSFGKSGLLFFAQASHCSGFSSCGTWTPGTRAQVVVVHRFVTPPSVESSLTWYQTHVPCFGRQTLNQWTTREVLSTYFFEYLWPLLTIDVQCPSSCDG